MNLDSFALSALVDEFMDDLVGGRIQDVLAVDPTGFGLEIYAHRQRHYLYLSADQQTPRVHLVDDKLRRGMYKSTQLGLMMRRYVEGGTLVHVSQPKWERILFLDIEHPEGEFRLVMEPMPRRANILLLRDNGYILDCVHRIGPGENSYRLSLPNHEYQLPPPLEGRLDPFEMSVDELETLMEDNEKDKLRRLLPKSIFGFSPLLAQEVAFRAVGDAEAKVRDVNADILHDSILQVVAPLKNREWQAGTAEEDGAIVAYSVFELTFLENWQSTASISAAMTAYYGAATGDQAYDQAKKPVQEAIEEGKAKFGAKVRSLENSLRDQSELDQLQQSGELILAYQYAIEPNQRELVAQYDFDAPELFIKIDPDLTPLENAQKYFDKYNRAKRALDNVPDLIQEAKVELDYMLQLESDLEMASSWPEIDDVTQSLQARGLSVLSKRKVQRIGGQRSGPMKLTKDGYVIWVGRNSRQNEEVTSRKANSSDIWLHARDVPGSHVVIRDDGRRIPRELIEEAAQIAAFYSKRRTDTKVDVDITRIKYVKPIRGAGPGMVTYRNEETITVQPASEEIWKDG